MTILSTRVATIGANAAPMITPMARSTTLPRIANSLNSSTIFIGVFLSGVFRLILFRQGTAAASETAVREWFCLRRKRLLHVFARIAPQSYGTSLLRAMDEVVCGPEGHWTKGQAAGHSTVAIPAAGADGGSRR